MATIKLVLPSQIEIYLEHLSRHFRERGVNGVICHPYSIHEPWNKDRLRSQLSKRWAQRPGEDAWEITWGLFEGEEIVGHLELVGFALPALRHRAKLGLGLENKYRSQGFGKQMMTTAIEWAQSQDFLAWIDLDVFTSNSAAISMYKSFGFVQTGKTIDRLRIDGESIDDLHFVLDLKKSSNKI